MEKKIMNELIQIIKLMEQAPNFSSITMAVFVYCVYRTIKSLVKEQFDEKVKNSMNEFKNEFKKDFNNSMDERIKPMEKKMENIEKNVYLLISNICPKNGL